MVTFERTPPMEWSDCIHPVIWEVGEENARGDGHCNFYFMFPEIPPKKVRQMEAIGFFKNEEHKMVTSVKLVLMFMTRKWQ